MSACTEDVPDEDRVQTAGVQQLGVVVELAQPVAAGIVRAQPMIAFRDADQLGVRAACRVVQHRIDVWMLDAGNADSDGHVRSPSISG